jgi:hypothetical protein
MSDCVGEWIEPSIIDHHPDDVAIQQFAVAMSEKMSLSRLNGRDGWQTCSITELLKMLRNHVHKGDPVDIANIAMMIWYHERKVNAEG